MDLPSSPKFDISIRVVRPKSRLRESCMLQILFYGYVRIQVSRYWVHCMFHCAWHALNNMESLRGDLTESHSPARTLLGFPASRACSLTVFNVSPHAILRLVEYSQVTILTIGDLDLRPRSSNEWRTESPMILALSVIVGPIFRSQVIVDQYGYMGIES